MYPDCACMDSDATQGIDFWKSSRNVLAVNTLMLTKLLGRRSHIVLLTQDEEDNTEDEEALETMPSLKMILSIS